MSVTRLELGENSHKNDGNINAAQTQETADSIVDYLKDFSKQYGESYATLFVRMFKKFKLHYEEKGVVDLPSSIKKQNLFEKSCFLHGWRAIPDVEIMCLKRGTRKRHFGRTVILLKFVHGGSSETFGTATCHMFESAHLVMIPVANVRFSIMLSGKAKRRTRSNLQIIQKILTMMTCVLMTMTLWNEMISSRSKR
jgi:hypothetical protein